VTWADRSWVTAGEMPRWQKVVYSLPWLRSYCWQRLVRRTEHRGMVHLVVAVADHFEPAIVPGAPPNTFAGRAEQQRRLDRWCRERPKVLAPWRDAEGWPWRHTYFFPAEQYDSELVAQLASHCRDGWGELEIQLHHGVEAPDTGANTRRLLLEFKGALIEHGALSRWNGTGAPGYGFVHGNWALANSARGRCCGVDNEMQILAETGCYADFTLPSAPNPAQTAKINGLYECALPLDERAPHRRGLDLRRGRPPMKFPIIIQGPLMLNYSRRRGGRPRFVIENGALARGNPPTARRLGLWRQAAIGVRGRPDWIFVKLHCHGMDPRDEEVMLGPPLRDFLRDLTQSSEARRSYVVHFVTAREMVNIALAACDGRDGNPCDYRDYRLRLINATRQP
jgi:hypothetical protein